MANDIDVSKQIAKVTYNGVEIPLAGFDEARAEGIEQGKQSEWNALWDGIQNFGDRTEYQKAFSGLGWTDENFNPKYPLKLDQAPNMFWGCGITDFTREGIVFDFSKAVNLNGFIQYSKGVEKLPVMDLSVVKSIYNLFNGFVGTDLEVIVSETTPWYYSFNSCTNLTNLTFYGTFAATLDLTPCPNLTHASVQSVINAMKDLTGQTAQTVSFHTDVLAKLTAEQADAITAKNWTF